MTLATWTRNGVNYDYAIGGLPFFNGIGAPDSIGSLRRGTAPYRKEQFDTSSNPGEQSLITWWLRSQSSFHYGAGLKYLDPTDGPFTQFQFSDCLGVEVSDRGRVYLLPKSGKVTNLKSMALGQMAAGTLTETTTSQKRNVLAASGMDPSTFENVFELVDPRNPYGATIVVPTAATGKGALFVNGAFYFLATDGVYKVTTATNGVPNLGSKIWSWTNASNACFQYAHNRIVAAVGNKLYELAGTGPSLPTPFYSLSDPNGSFTCIAEGPNAIYAAERTDGDAEGRIYKFVLDTSGAVPTLSAGIVAAQLPPGESVWSLASVVGTYMAIGTNKGVRVARFKSNGDLEYGPLHFT